MSNFNYSFEQWCIDNNRLDLKDRWDTDANGISCSDVSFKSNKKYYFKCPEGKHDSSSYTLYDIASGKNKVVKCKACSSFAQAIIDKYGKGYLKKVWSKDNTVDPWKVASHANRKFLFVCENDSSHVYPQTLDYYMSGIRCPYCSNRILLKENSLGSKFPESVDVWSDRNSKSPYDYSPSSAAIVWWKCENGLHEDFRRKICNSNTRQFKCPECQRAKMYKSRRSDLSGQVFGELTAIEIDEAKSLKHDRIHWKCVCSCGKHVSVAVSNLTGGDATTCGNRKIHYSGRNNGNWKGGVTPELLSARTSSDYNAWRDEVYKKDWYTCQCCGSSHGIIKHAHHLKNFSENKEMRYDINNGILLCDNCHSAIIPSGFHYIYGTINNTPEQLEEYINHRRKELGMNVPFSIKRYLSGDILKPDIG